LANGQATLPVAQPIQKPQVDPKASPAASSPDVPPDGPPAGSSAWQDRFQGLLEASPSFLISSAVHMAVILLLALWYLPEIPKLTVGLLESLPSEEVDDVSELEPLELDPTELEDLPDAVEVQPDTNVIAETVSFSAEQDVAAPPAFMELADFGADSAPESLVANIGPVGTTGTDGRGAMSRTGLVRRGGGNESTEIAVAMALKWLAEHQNPDGSWSLDHTGGACQGRCDHAGTLANGNKAATALALLPCLGAGQTHKEGKYQKVVTRGLDALVRMGEKTKDGVSWRDGGTMYSHGLATIALCEAYGMSEDDRLYLPAQAAIAYIAYAQDPKGGGWRYNPRTPGDTSVVGWQIMALKSGHLAGLIVPPGTVAKTTLFLDSAQRDDGARYVYVPERNAPATNPLSAVGLLSRMYLGWKKDNPALKDGVERLAKAGPSKNNYYYNYYAAQVLFQYTGGTGSMWRTWNEALRDQLVAQQEKSGHAKGSWYVEQNHNARGGRILCTSLATMTLEVYYRYMPIYQTDAVDQEFPE
jgi:hypothetical protein